MTQLECLNDDLFEVIEALRACDDSRSIENDDKRRYLLAEKAAIEDAIAGQEQE